jgi:hypothetical protein
MKMEAAHSGKLLVCIIPKHINEDPNLHWNMISKSVQTVPICCQCVHNNKMTAIQLTIFEVWFFSHPILLF